MSLLNHIWNARLGRLLALGALSLAALLVPSTVSATGEKYNWTDNQYSAITATDGNYSGKATFNKESGNATSATYTSTTSVSCAGSTKPITLKITMGADAFSGGKPIIPTIADLDAGTACPSVTWTTTISIDDTQGSVAKATGAGNADEQLSGCDQGKMGWLFCPVLDNLSGTVTKLAKEALVPLLKVKTLTPEDTPDIYHAWERMRDLSSILFIIVFFLIIYGTAFQQDIPFFDNYTIRKIWPRLIFGAVLAQFSFQLCAFIVDFGNVSGAGVEILLQQITAADKGAASIGNVMANLVVDIGVLGGAAAGLAVLASWTVAFPVLLSLLMSLLVVFLTLGARYLFIAVLVVVSPLVIVAWIAPNTRNIFKDWFEFLFKLVMMYPIIVGILSIAGLLNQIIPKGPTDSAAASVAAALVKPLIIIAAFAAVPVSFRLAGKGLHKTYGLLNNLSGKGKTALKASDMYQRGVDERQRRKNTYMGRVLNSRSITSLQRKGALGRGAAGMLSFGASAALLRAPSNHESLQRSNSLLIAKTRKQLDELKEAQNPYNLLNALQAYAGRTPEEQLEAKKKLQQAAPGLLRYASTAAGREAMAKMLYDTGFADKDMLSQFLETPSKRGLARFGTSGNVGMEFKSLRDAGQHKRTEMPGIVMRTDQAIAKYDIVDRAGNKIRTDSRRLGDIDINGVAKYYSKATANDLALKQTVDNFQAMAEAANAKATARQRSAGKDIAEGFAIGVEAKNLSQIFDVTSRNAAAPEKKIQIMMAMKANRDAVFATSREYKEKYNAVMDRKNLEQDVALTTQLVRKAHLDEVTSSASYQRLSDPQKEATLARETVFINDELERMKVTERAEAVEQWMGKFRL